MTIKIEPRNEGTTVREFLTNELGLSRNLLTRLKNISGGIRKNGIEVTVRALLESGDLLALKLEDGICDVNELILPLCLPINIIYEDSDIIAVNKPYGMPTHPSLSHTADSLANALAYYYKALGIYFVFRAVNRLDRDTGGIVLVAKNQLIASKLSHQMMCGDIKTHIRRKNGSIILREVCSGSDIGGRYAHTSYKTIAVTDKYTIADVMTTTGRTHQIRVHFAHIGHPLVGDYLYGPAYEGDMLHHALHARMLKFTHPATGKQMTLQAAPAPEWAGCRPPWRRVGLH